MNGVQNSPDPQAELIKAVANANPAPQPPEWVQESQMALAALLFLLAFALAFLLVFKGPPAPKASEGSEGGTAPTKTTGPSGQSGPSGPSGPTTSALHLTAASEPAPGSGEGGSSPGDSPAPGEGGGAPGEEPGGEGTTDEATDGTTDGATDGADEGSSTDSLASLDEQAPWAFAIVALLVGAFLATGKTLSFGGISGGGKAGDEN
jgi:hypothetical protein